MRRTTPLTAATLLALALALALALPVPTTAASAAGETCRGEAATIVGTAPTLTGTEGRDVIVTGKAYDVFALGGDDLVCVVPEGLNSNLLDVDAGAGNDVVDTTGTRGGYYVDTVLGIGADTFVGGRAIDAVATGPGEGTRVDAETDLVDTGASGDTVATGSTDGPNHDRVETGPGTDYIDLRTPALAPDGLISGGPDEDVLTVSPVPGEVALDMGAETLVTTAGNAVLSSLEDVVLEAGSGRISYRGTDGDDSLRVQTEPSVAAPDLVVNSLGGDDRLVVEPGRLGPASRIDAGAGADELIMAADTGRLALDLKANVLEINDRAIPAAGLDGAHLMAPEVDVVGDSQDNSLRYAGCDATLRGGPGDDYLANVYDGYFETYTFDCAASASMSGGTGKDYLRGGSGTDRLSGGRGHDSLAGRGDGDRLSGGDGRDALDGGEGGDELRGGPGPDIARGGADRDLCRAEQKRSCER